MTEARTLAVTTVYCSTWSDASPFHGERIECPPPWIYPPATPTVLEKPPTTVTFFSWQNLYSLKSCTPAPTVTAGPLPLSPPSGTKSSLSSISSISLVRICSECGARERPAKSWPVFFTTTRTLCSRAKVTAAAMSSAERAATE